MPAADLAAGVEEWSLLTEVPSTGASVHAGHSPWSEDGKIRSIDVLLLRNWASKPRPHERVAVEIKVSRSDFRRESDAKRAPWRVLAHRFVYATPEGLLTPQDIPDGCWLIEVSEHDCDGRSTGHKHSPRRVHWHRRVRGVSARTVETPPEMLTVIARTASRAQTRLVRADERDAAAAAMGEVSRLRRQVQDLKAREHANAAKVRSLLNLVAPVLPQECADCGGPLTVVPARRHTYARWEHTDPMHEQQCPSRWGPEPALVRGFDLG